jgi:hypothetical protein
MPVSHWRRVEEDVKLGVESSELETIQLDVEYRKAAVFLLVDDIDGATHAEESCPNVASHAIINKLVFIMLLVL